MTQKGRVLGVSGQGAAVAARDVRLRREIAHRDARSDGGSQ